MAVNRASESGVLLRNASAAFLVVSLYVLSVGPVKKLAWAGYLPKHAVNAVYRPLCVFNGTPVETALVWYMQRWFPADYIGD